MMNLQLIPVFSQSGGSGAEIPAKATRTFSEKLNEAVVVIFFSLGPAIGATIFLLWFGGLMWGLISSLLR